MVNPESLVYSQIDVSGQAAKIDIIGSIITIIGESVSIYAAALAIEEEKNKTNSTPNNENLVNELKEMKEQIQYLTNEIQSLKKNQNRGSP